MSLYLAFVMASAALILIPGPNVAVIVANSVRHGALFGLVTVAGTSAAMVVQLSLTVAGLSGVLALAAHWFEVLRWVGVLYLVYLGIQAWRAPAHDLSVVRALDVTRRQMFVRGFLVSLTNPKTLLFYAAFLPQFVSGAGNPTGELLLLAATFLVLAVVLDGCWALLAARVRGVLAPTSWLRGQLVNRLTGGVFFAAATGLLLARRPT